MNIGFDVLCCVVTYNTVISVLVQINFHYRFAHKKQFCAFRYQQVLHRNLVYLATVADANQNVQQLLPVNMFILSYF